MMETVPTHDARPAMLAVKGVRLVRIVSRHCPPGIQPHIKTGALYEVAAVEKDTAPGCRATLSAYYYREQEQKRNRWA